MIDLKFKCDPDKCVRCGLCVLDCPNRVICLPQDAEPAVAHGRERQCIGCQHCLAVCPTGSLSILGLDPERSMTVDPALLPTPTAMGALFRSRRSTRSYLRENVPRSLIEAILAELQYAPVGHNDGFREFLLVDDLKAMDALREGLIALSERALAAGLDSPFVRGVVKYYRRDGIDIVFRGAPHLLVVSASSRNTTPDQDVTLALAYFELLAACHGLGTCWCGFLNLVDSQVPGVRELLGLAADDSYYPMYFGLPAVRYRRTVQRDGASRIRRLGQA